MVLKSQFFDQTSFYYVFVLLYEILFFTIVQGCHVLMITGGIEILLYIYTEIMIYRETGM